MLNIIVLAAVAVFTVGIIVGVNSIPLNSSSSEQVFSDAVSASLDVPQLDESDLRRMANSEQLGARINLVIWLNSQIAEDEAKHRLSISELAGLRMIKAELEAEVAGAALAR